MPDLADILAGRGSALLGAGGFSIVAADPDVPAGNAKLGRIAKAIDMTPDALKQAAVAG